LGLVIPWLPRVIECTRDAWYLPLLPPIHLSVIAYTVHLWIARSDSRGRQRLITMGIVATAIVLAASGLSFISLTFYRSRHVDAGLCYGGIYFSSRIHPPINQPRGSGSTLDFV